MITNNKNIDSFTTRYNEEKLELLPVFIREMDSCFGNLRKAVQSHDYVKARAKLHQMLGASRIVNEEKLELQIQQVQLLVKTNQPIESMLPILSQMSTRVDSLFSSLKDQRLAYAVHLLDDQEKIMTLKEELLEVKQIDRVTTSVTLEECLQNLTDDNGEILVADCYNDETCLQTIQDTISSHFLNVPILIFSFDPRSKYEKLKNKYENLCGYIHRQASVKKLMEGIKTIANGRDFWQ